MLALILKVVDFLRYAKARDYNGVLTQAITWVAGVVVLLLVAQTTWAAMISVAGVPLGKLGFWSVVFAGLTVSSGASLVNDYRKALDNSNSAAIPTLLPAGPANPPGTVNPAPPAG
jgi:hypothetical protein